MNYMGWDSTNNLYELIIEILWKFLFWWCFWLHVFKSQCLQVPWQIIWFYPNINSTGQDITLVSVVLTCWMKTQWCQEISKLNPHKISKENSVYIASCHTSVKQKIFMWDKLHISQTKATVNNNLNSSPPSTTYMRRWIRWALVQIVAWRQIGTKSLSKPMQGYCHLDPQEQTSMNP